jgi:hypothetical protein
MAIDPLLPLSTVEALIRATAEGVTRGVLAACAVEETVAEPLPALGTGPQIWDGEGNILDSSDNQIGYLTGWLKGDQVIEIAEFDTLAHFQTFISGPFKFNGLTSTSDQPYDKIKALEGGWASSGPRGWGLLVGTHEAGLSAATAEGLFEALSGTVTWFKLVQSTKSVGFLYRQVDSTSATTRIFDQWFLSSTYTLPSTADVDVSTITAPANFAAAVAYVAASVGGTPTWTVQKFRWHIRPTSVAATP